MSEPNTFFLAAEPNWHDGRIGEWFTPTQRTRGPWDPTACHAGPPTGLLVRAMERAVPAVRLARVTVDLAKPVPMDGFRIDVEITRSGRSVATTRATLIDANDVVRVTAIGLHVAPAAQPVIERPLDNSGVITPRVADSHPGPFPIEDMAHGLAGFGAPAVMMRYPDGEEPLPGATTAWMKTVSLLPDEEPSPFQRICPLADCGNAFGRHMNADEMQFVNADLTIALHRDPVGDWLGTRAVSQWQPGGVGLADALLFDDTGLVGRALQIMVLRRPAATSRNGSRGPRR